MAIRTRARLALNTLAAIALMGPPAAAQTTTIPTASQTIVVAKNKSAAFRMDGPVGKVVIAQPDIAEIVATTDCSFYIRGKALGSTNVLVYGPDHRLSKVIDVDVGYDAAGLQSDIAKALPDEHIVVSTLSGGLLLTGDASNNMAADRALALAEQAAPKAVTSTIRVRDAQQIALDVRIVEVNRTALEDFGIDVNAANGTGNIVFSAAQGVIGSANPAGTLTVGPRLGSGSLTATLRALEQKGQARTLAKPNLVALSGQDASFLAGGEIPVPVPNGLNAVTIEYRQFGVQLAFTPTLYPDNMIRLKVSPEVSQLDPAHGVTIVGYVVPALTVRRAATTIELRDGQSFAIAGLFQHTYANTLNQLPGMSQLPVLGVLFRSANWQRNETELVIIVTPHLVTGESPPPPEAPADADEPSAIDVILQGLALENAKSAPTAAGKS
jgi:pilus assembly protein CpaC